jgi:hypothetical protein
MGTDESLLSLKRNQKLVGVEPGFPDAVTTADSGAGSETRHLHQQKKGLRGEDRVQREENAKNKNQQTDIRTDDVTACLRICETIDSEASETRLRPYLSILPE